VSSREGIRNGLMLRMGIKAEIKANWKKWSIKTKIVCKYIKMLM
jgi:hypothetical protein